MREAELEKTKNEVKTLRAQIKSLELANKNVKYIYLFLCFLALGVFACLIGLILVLTGKLEKLAFLIPLLSIVFIVVEVFLYSPFDEKVTGKRCAKICGLRNELRKEKYKKAIEAIEADELLEHDLNKIVAKMNSIIHSSSSSSSGSSSSSSGSSSSSRTLVDGLGYKSGSVDDNGYVLDDHGYRTGYSVDSQDHVRNENRDVVGNVKSDGNIDWYKK